VVGIGTPGLDRENALWSLRQGWYEAGGQVPGFRFREHAAPEGCDLTDESAWRVANPALDAGYQNVEALRSAVKLSPESHFRIFHLGQWIDGTDNWLGPDGRRVWDALIDPYPLVPGARTWVGVDIGLKRDSTAVVLGQRRPDGRLHVHARIWLPRTDEAVDLGDIMRYLRELDGLYDLEAVAYDPRLFELPAQMLGDEGLPMLELPQSLERMSPAFGQLLESIKRGELSHDGQVDFGTQVLNAVPRYSERGFTLAKARSRGRIDAAYALAMMHSRASVPAPVRKPLVALF
jgi:phage terminase large subunit-like protein